MRKLGLAIQALKGMATEQYVKTISELGFQVTFTGMCEEKQQEEYANLIAKYGLEYETIHAPFGHINDIWFESEAGTKMLSELLTCVDRCVLANVPAMVVHLSSGINPPATTDIGRMRFEQLVEYARRKNVKIAFENNRTITNLAWALETFSEDDGVGFCWDCGHEACYTPGIEFMPLFGKRLICTHIHDNQAVYDQDLHMIPFDGVINYERFAEHIRNSEYKGPLTLELCVPFSNYYDNMSPEEYLERASIAAKRLASMVCHG